MRKHLSTAVWLSLLGAVAFAGDLSITGTTEGGWGFSSSTHTTALSGNTATQKDSGFFLDYLSLGTTYKASDKTKVVVNTDFAANAGRAGGMHAANGEINNFSRFAFGTATAAGHNAMMAFGGAYVDHQCSENWNTQFGLVSIPLGMESNWGRYDNHSYYWSTAHGVRGTMGWNVDLGLKETINAFGKWELAITDGRATQDTYSPLVALAWSNGFKFGADFGLNPTVSILTNSWRKTPEEMAFTVGTGLTWRDLFFNVEFFHTKLDRAQGTDTATKVYSLWFEPGYNLGFMKVSLKWDMHNTKIAAGTAQSDNDLGLAISHEYNDKLRVKLAYQYSNLSAKLADKAHDFRLMFGTKF